MQVPRTVQPLAGGSQVATRHGQTRTLIIKNALGKK
jgi:hypothetical protein